MDKWGEIHEYQGFLKIKCINMHHLFNFDPKAHVKSNIYTWQVGCILKAKNLNGLGSYHVLFAHDMFKKKKQNRGPQ